MADIVAILREEVAELVRLGATYVQIDAPHYGLLLDPKTRLFYEKLGWSLDRWLSLGIELDNAVIAGFPDVTFGFHV
jgi:5-methyltetrahydropteroyltriglutamate--homocysteine methyltransferase